MLPPDVLRAVCAHLGQQDKVACLAASRYLYTVVSDRTLWQDVTIRRPDETALRMLRRVRPASVTIEAAPDDAVWLMSQFDARGVRRLRVHLGLVTRVPEALLLTAATRFRDVEHLSIVVEECEQLSMLRLPTRFAGLRRLHTLELREGRVGTDPWAGSERSLVVAMGPARAHLAELQCLTVVCAKTDVLRGLDRFPKLRSAVVLAEEETYEGFVPPRTLQHLELAMFDAMRPLNLAHGLQHVALDSLVLHVCTEAYLSQCLPAKRLVLVMDRRLFGAELTVRAEFQALAAVRDLAVTQTDSSLPGWAVRVVAVPDVGAALPALAAKKLRVHPSGQLELTPFDY